MVMYVPDVLVGSVADPDPPDPYNFPGSVSMLGLLTYLLLDPDPYSFFLDPDPYQSSV